MSKSKTFLEGLTVLVVDDEPDALTFISTILEDYGAKTIQAKDGFEALEMARSNKPDLMTLDLGMPGKNGVDVYIEMRADRELRSIPVCIVTGRPEMRKLIYERTSTPPPEGYMDKPVNEENLLMNIRKIIEVDRKKSYALGLLRSKVRRLATVEESIPAMRTTVLEGVPFLARSD